MYGRKIKRGLPLLEHDKSTFDENRLQQKDEEAKLAGKQREDARHGARYCKIKPGDEVIIERYNRSKGDSRFSSSRHTVMEERNGSLILSDNHGKLLKRHVSQTKKVRPWRDLQRSGNGNHQETTNTSPDISKRQSRERRAPAFLSDYALSVQES